MRSDAGPDDDGISIRRILHAPCKQVFEAWTRPELMARWFFAGNGWTTKVSADVRVGGRYELTMRDTSPIRRSAAVTRRAGRDVLEIWRCSSIKNREN